MPRLANPSMLQFIEGIATGEDKKWRDFESKVVRGSAFDNDAAKRALELGYTTDDINGYLKYTGTAPKGFFQTSGTAPTGDFAAAGTVSTSTSAWGTKDSGSVRPETKDTTYYKYTGPATASASSSSSGSTSPATPSAATPTAPIVAPGNPELMIPRGAAESTPGENVRLTSESLGIKAKNSSARQAGLINKGTGRLTIPRSSGFNPLNFG